MEWSKTKATVAAVGALVETLKVILLDNVVSMDEWAQITSSILILGVTVYTVWRVPNKPIPAPVEGAHELG